MKSIQVIPYRVGIMADGSKASMFSAGVVSIKETGKFTWRVVDHRGTATTGLCRVPADTLEEAQAIAANVADLRGYTVLS